MSAARYAGVWVCLAALTAGTWYVSEHIPLGVWAMPVALAFATAKALLIALFFMHLWFQRGATRVSVLVALIFLALLGGLVVADLATRFEPARPPGPFSFTVEK